MSEWTYARALGQALQDGMALDPAVIVLGEDVAHGGVFGVTQGLVEQFGARRVRNTPISEAAITGFGVGAALAGLHPVVEIMFMDFLTLALDMLVNQAAKLPYLSGGQLQVPLVIRTQAGALGGAGAHHSQSLEAWLVHVPGLSVLVPATPGDAYRGLRWAMAQQHPVVVVESKALYGTREDRSAGEDLGGEWRPVCRRTGSDATLVCYGTMVRAGLAAAELLAGEGISVEVWDLRALAPLCLEPVQGSLAKTHHLVVAHEAVATGGVGAEVAARLQALAFDELDAPILRVGAREVPLGVSPTLEAEALPGPEKIAAALREVLA